MMPSARLRYLLGRHTLLILGLFLVGLMSLAAIFAPLLSTHDPLQQNLDAILLAPGPGHFLGTDELGRDMFSRMLYGARVSLWVGFVSVGISVSIGLALMQAGIAGLEELLERADRALYAAKAAGRDRLVVDGE